MLAGPLGDRVLFGTDYYMTLREAPEADLVSRCRSILGPALFARMAGERTDHYLRSRHFDPAVRFTTARTTTPPTPAQP